MEPFPTAFTHKGQCRWAPLGIELDRAALDRLLGDGTLLPAVQTEMAGIPRPATQLARAPLAPIVLGAPYTGGVWWIARSNPLAGWLSLGGHIAGAVLVYLALCSLLLLDRETRRQVTQRLVLVRAPG